MIVKSEGSSPLFFSHLSSLMDGVENAEKPLETSSEKSSEKPQEKSSETLVPEIPKSVVNLREVKKPPPKDEDVILVKLLCNWCNPKQLCERWNRQSKGNFRWNNIAITWEDEPKPDYTVVVNCPPINYTHDPNMKTILFHMEPDIPGRKDLWGEWSNPDRNSFVKICDHATEYNNLEWHLSKTYEELLSYSPTKTMGGSISTVLSEKYRDEGHVMRIDFAKFLETKDGIDLHVYGNNKYRYKNYKGSPPHGAKDEALFPYRYTFNVENQFRRNYFTEKLVDGILAECLVFYHGCINVKEFIDERAFVWLEMANPEDDYALMKKAVDENWWEQRLPYIRAAKKKILEEQQFFPRLEKIIEDDRKNVG